MTKYMQDLLVSYTAAVEHEATVADMESETQQWARLYAAAKNRRAERRARLVDAIERLEEQIK